MSTAARVTRIREGLEPLPPDIAAGFAEIMDKIVVGDASTREGEGSGCDDADTSGDPRLAASPTTPAVLDQEEATDG